LNVFTENFFSAVEIITTKGVWKWTGKRHSKATASIVFIRRVGLNEGRTKPWADRGYKARRMVHCLKTVVYLDNF
jgi:hypothetical protein